MRVLSVSTVVAAIVACTAARALDVQKRATCETGPNVRICTDVNFTGDCIDLTNPRNQYIAIPTEWLGVVSSIDPYSCGNGEDCLAGFADGSTVFMFSGGLSDLASIGEDNQLTKFRCDW